jgi:hypothetical protein
MLADKDVHPSVRHAPLPITAALLVADSDLRFRQKNALLQEGNAAIGCLRRPLAKALWDVSNAVQP